MTFYGFDSSRYQGSFTAPELQASGMSFWYFKGTGGDNGLYEDPDFGPNMIAAQAWGGKYGVYHFAGNTVSTTEADYAYNNTWSGLTTGATAILDVERGSGGLPSVQWVVDFLNQSHDHLGFWPLVYMNQSTENSYDWSPVVALGVGLIIADYAVAPNGTVGLKHWPFYFGQQYSSTGTVAGKTPVDLDAIFATDLSVWDKYGKPAPVTTPPVIIPPVTPPVVAPVPTPAPGTIVKPSLPENPDGSVTIPVKVIPKPVPVLTPPNVLDQLLAGKCNKTLIAFVTTAITYLATRYNANHLVKDVVYIANVSGVWHFANTSL